MLRLDAVSFRYTDAGEPALKNVDLQVPAGAMVAVLGPQGSGTSTLCRLLAGLLDEHGTFSGHIQAAEGSPPHDSGVLMIGEDPEAQLTGMASLAADEIRLPGRLHGLQTDLIAERAEQAMAALDIGPLAERRVETLSGGERQLTALAGLLTLRDGSLLVLDQPTLSLDAAARTRLLAALQRHCARGGSVLVTGHQHDDVTAACQRIHLLEDGQLSEGRTDRLSTEQLAAHGIWDARPPETAPASAQHGSDSSPCRPAPSEAKALEVRGLSVRRDTRSILSGLNLRLAQGEAAVVLGPNGSGKSTLFTALSGLLEKKPGTEISGRIIAADGTDLTALPAHRRAGCIAWVGQDPGAQISASTVQKELEQALPLPRGRSARSRGQQQRAGQIADVLRRTGLAEQAREHPYDLSPAQRKDLVIASALLLEPVVLLLDEPTLGRDATSMAQLNTLIGQLTAEGTAVLIATHDHRWARSIASTVYCVENGGLSCLRGPSGPGR